MWLATPHAREIAQTWELGVKLLAFACLCVRDRVLPVGVRRASTGCCTSRSSSSPRYLFPRISYFYYCDGERAQVDSFYTHLYLLLYPGDRAHRRRRLPARRRHPRGAA